MQSVYQPPTGYPDGAEQWVNTGALLERLNFARALLVRQLNEKVEPKPKTAAGPDVRPAPMEGPVALQISLFGGDPRFGGRTWRKPDLDTAQVEPRVARAFGLVLGSPEFQRR